MSPFRVLKPTDPYYANWLDMRRRRKWEWASPLIWLLAAFPLGGILAACFGPSHGTFIAGFLLAGLIVVSLVPSRMSWPCPRCGRPFYATWWVYWPFADGCLHCGLYEYAPDDPDARSTLRTG